MLEIIKEVSQNLLEAKQLCDVLLGIVETLNPITIRVDQKLIIDESFLVFSRTALGVDTDYRLGEVDTSHTHPSASFNSKTMHKHKLESLNEYTEEVSVETSHSHGKAGEIYELKHRHKTEGLCVGDGVIMIRQNGGQLYFVIDKVGEI